MEHTPKRSLRNIIINPSLQLKLVGTAILICTLTQCSLLAFQMLSFNAAEGRLLEAIESSESCSYLLGDLELTLYQSVTISFILGVVLCAVVLLMFTHRIAGPIFKMTRFLNEVADDPTKDRKIYFRKNDYFSELAEAYNRKFDKSDKPQS